MSLDLSDALNFLEKKNEKKEFAVYEYDLGTVGFQTKKKLKTFVQEFLALAPEGYRPTEKSRQWIDRLFSRHPDKDRVLNFHQKKIRIQSYFKFKCFSILENGSYEPISFHKCLSYNRCTDVKKAFRDAISFSIMKFKREKFKNRVLIPCDLCGNPLYREDCDIDHHFEKLPFNEILNDFLMKNQLDLNSIDIERTNRLLRYELANKSLRKRFKSYHDRVAHLRAIHRHENRSAKKKLCVYESERDDPECSDLSNSNQNRSFILPNLTVPHLDRFFEKFKFLESTERARIADRK